MTRFTAWEPPTFKLVLPDRARWPFTSAHEEGSYRKPPNGWWIMYVLDTVTGQLTAVANDPSHPRGPELGNGGGGYDPARDLWVRDYHWDHAPKLIGFPWAFHNPLPLDRVCRDMELIAPRAEHLLKNLQPVPGTSDWDWTPEAVMAHQRICSVTHTGLTDEDFLQRMETAEHSDPDLHVITVEQLIDLYPELVAAWPPFATMSDTQIDDLATGLCNGRVPPRPPEGLIAKDDNAGWSEWYARADKHAPEGYRCTRYVAGARASLRRLRAERAEALTGFPAAPASPFFAEHPVMIADRISPDLSADDVNQLAAVVVAEVGRDHALTLVGVTDHILRERARLRELVRGELDRVGTQAEDAARVARQLGLRRTHLVSQVAAWQDPADQRDGTLNQAALAQRAHMSRQGLSQLLARLEQGEDTSAIMPAGPAEPSLRG